MARCILSTYIEHDYLERMDAEAARRGITRAALARETLQAAFPPDVQQAPVASVAAEDDE